MLTLLRLPARPGKGLANGLRFASVHMPMFTFEWRAAPNRQGNPSGVAFGSGL